QIITELSPDNWVYPGKKSYVITHRKLHSANEEIIFTDEDFASLIQRLKQEPGKDIWICGGASIIHQLVELDLIDYYTLTVVPTILGSGTALFSAHSKEVKLQTIATQRYNGFIETTYKRREHV
ncbi:MAG: dihydrofolate reductase family protein, partial [Bacteroidales bacterium]